MGTLEELRESRDREATERLESKMAKPAGFVRKEAQVQWQTLKIPFITGGPGPANKKEPHPKPQVITCKRFIKTRCPVT